MSMRRLTGLAALAVLLIVRASAAFPLTWDPYLRYLNTQVTEAEVDVGETYWRVAEGYAVPPPDEGFGDVKIWFRAIDENGSPLSGVPVRIFATSTGQTLGGATAPGEYNMGGGNWLDFYNELGPYSIEVNAAEPGEACMGLGLPANQHFSYTIVFQRAIKGVTPTAPQPTPLGKPDGTNLLINPGAEAGDMEGWSHNNMQLNGDIYNNCGNRAGAYRFSWQTFGFGGASLSQTVPVNTDKEYTFGFWVCKKSENTASVLTATWSDPGGGGGTLYTMPTNETIFPIYGTRQDAVIAPQGSPVTLTISMNYGSAGFAAFHLDEFWLVEVTPPPPEYPGDLDGDTDSDQEDFGRFQACLTGDGVTQADPSCEGARLDGDLDVDDADTTIFLGCMSGANVTVDPECAGS